MQDINEFIKKPKDDRQKHLRLEDPCIERGSNHSYLYKGLLAHFFDTTIPTGRMINVCHACHNGACGNIHHLYWGTAKENRQDHISNGGHKSPYDAMVRKYGVEEARKMNKRSSEKAALGGKAGAGKTKSPEHKAAISEAIKKKWILRKEAG